MPVPGALAAAGVADDADALGAAAGAAAGALVELAAEGGVALDRVAAVGRAALAAAGALPMLTSGVILLIVAAETPAFDKSLTEEYGRPAMISFAVASPTPGRLFSSAALAVFRSTCAPPASAALCFGAGAGAPPAAVTDGVIFLIVAAETPAFDKSSTEEYGRPAMIFFAVASPTPGNASNCAALALFRSTGASLAPGALGFAAAVDLLAADFVGAGDAPLTVTEGVIFLIVVAETPAFERSLTVEYGRPAIIFLAVAAPTPGSVSSCASLALFRSTVRFAAPDCLALPVPTEAKAPNASTAIVRYRPANFRLFLIDRPKVSNRRYLGLHGRRIADHNPKSDNGTAQRVVRIAGAFRDRMSMPSQSGQRRWSARWMTRMVTLPRPVPLFF